MFSVLHRFIVASLFCILTSATSFCQDPLVLTKQMFGVVNNVKNLQYTFESKERINGKLRTEIMSFKISTNPLKTYVYQHSPKNGLQILYIDGKPGGKARVNPGGFPWTALNLDPEGELMLENRHHSIFDAGFAYTISVIQYLMEKYPSQSNKLLTINENENILGSECYNITFTNPNYRLILYTAQDGDTPLSIAKKLHINFYAIMENNSGLKPTSKVKAGTRLIVPNDYASKMQLYISKNLMYPVYLKIYDNKGLFEEFLFKNVVLNPVFKEIDFSEKNPAYKF